VDAALTVPVYGHFTVNDHDNVPMTVPGPEKPNLFLMSAVPDITDRQLSALMVMRSQDNNHPPMSELLTNSV
jgi:hypothetical protein